ncbi:hypothetical protein [Aliarcobacter butzleri]|uniref:Barnase-EndoU-ColicinE5/D-RelE like domain-containing protein n=2 Tax=Aliarcobacter butzleri TaxID=28197 RepID=A0A0G9JR10_9BACT|nr:hypothetical protein [Aliarcobacter butzleri]KLD96703.1 hypothetical protein AA20_11445 [Aliarcobacter butzleri L348]
MPKDNNAPSQNWNIKDQIEQSKKINQDNKQTIDDYKAKTESIKTIQSSLDELENSGQDVSVLRKKFDEKISNNDLSFGEKLGVVGRNIGNDYVSSFSKAFGGNLEKTYSTNLDDIKQKREEVINPISTIASEVALDPLTYTPLSLATKGTKTVRMAKDFVKGGALSAGLYTAKEYGDDNYKPTDSLIAGAFGGALNAGIGRFINRKNAGDLPNTDVTSSDDIANKFIYEQKKVNPEVVTKPTQPTADELVQENIIKTDSQDEIAKRIYEANFKNKDNLIKTDDLKTNKIVNQNDIELAPIKEKSVLPDTLPLNDKEVMKDIMKYAKDNNAVDEFISKLPQNARVDEVRQVFDKMPISQVKEANVLNQMSVQEPRKTNSGIYYSNGTQSFGGASVGGLESEFNQRDYNYDGEHNYKDSVIGALIGAIGINAARKILPGAFRDKNIDANTTGMFVGKSPTDGKDLMIQHNLSQDNLRYANSKGGIVAPSLATVKKDMPIDGFGDITLIGDKALATPSKEMKAFASDIYSPRHPREIRAYNQSDIRKIDNSLMDYIHKTGGGDVSTSNDVSNLIDNVALKAKFLEEQKGISLKIPNRVNPQEQTLKQFYKSEYSTSISNKGLDYQTLARDPKFQEKVAKELTEKYKDNEKALNIMLQPDRLINLAKDRAMNLDQIGRSQNKPDLYKAREIADKYITKYKSEFESYVKNIQESYPYKSSFNNNGKQQPYTEQNVLKYLTSNLRGGENFNYGAGNIRATVTPEFKTIEQIKKAKERLVTSKEFEAIKSSIDNELSDIISKISDDGIDNSFTAREIASEFISDYAKRGKRALNDYSVKVKPENFAEIDSFLNKLKEMPTEYFESKFLGKMELSKFKLAIIPKNASKETKDILASHGIKYKTYDPKLPDSRIEVIKREAEKNNVLFASPTVSGGMVGAITGATSDLDNDGKITYKDLLYGAIGGAGLTKGVLMAKDSHIIQKSRELFKKASDTDFADAIIGHKIYEKKDYMNIREDMLKAKNQKLEDFTQLHEQLKLLDDSTRKDMYKYMSGDKNINLDTNIKTLADSYTNEINKLSKEMVDLGILDEAQFDKFKDRYLHRRYDKDLSQKFNSLFSKGKTVSGVFSRGKEWSGTKAEYEKLLNNGEIGDFFNGKIEATKMQNGQYKFRQDWTDEQRTKWGEIQDIAFSLPETLMRSTEMVQHGKMLKKIVDETKYVSDEALDGYVQLNGNKYGALKGKYVPKDMASDINEFHSAIFGNEGGLFSKDVVDAYKALSSFWKKTHTVYNPIAHMNNLLSNITMQFGAGINPHKAVKNAYKGAITSQKVKQFRELKAKELIGLSSEERVSLNALIQDDDIKLWNEAQRAGLFGRSGLNDILNQYVNPTKATNSSNLTGTRKVLNKFDDLASKAYQGEDNIMRFSMLKSLTEKGKSLDEAIKEINNTIPDYTKPMSRLARFGRDSMLTPFISWTYYSTPIILKQFKDRPERIAAIYASLYGLNKLAGIDPFDEKDIPQQNFAMKRIPIYKNGNEVTTIKVDRWIPHNDMLNPIDMAKNLTNGGAWRAIPDILNNSNSYFGGKITNNEGALKAYDLSKYGIQQITPDILDNVWNLAESKMLSKEKRTKNPVIQPRTTTQELLKFFGINSMTYNKANQARKVANEKIK